MINIFWFNFPSSLSSKWSESYPSAWTIMVGNGPNQENWVKYLLNPVLYALACIVVFLILIQYCFTQDFE